MILHILEIYCVLIKFIKKNLDEICFTIFCKCIVETFNFLQVIFCTILVNIFKNSADTEFNKNSK